MVHQLGRDGLLIFDGLAEPKQTVGQIAARFEAYFCGAQSSALHRKRFMRLTQSASETIQQFAARIRREATLCNYGAFLNEISRDVFISGVYSDTLGEKLLVEDLDNLTFERAVAIAEVAERAHIEREQIKSSEKVDYVERRQVESNNRTQQNNRDFKTNRSVCYRCDKNHDRDKCPALDKTCFKCGRKGHFASACKAKNTLNKGVLSNKISSTLTGMGGGVSGNRKINSVAKQSTDNADKEEDSDNSISLFKVFAMQNTSHIHVEIANKRFECIADTGAARNILPSHLYKGKSDKCNLKLKAFGGAEIEIVGSVELPIRYNDVEFLATFILVNTPDENFPLLCTDTCVNLGILDELKVACNKVVPACVNENADLFEGLGRVKKVRCQLFVKENAIPRCFATRRLPPALLGDIEKQLAKLEKLDVIEKITYSEWCFPIVPVRKKDGSVRICVDFRYLNESLIREPFQLPSLEEIFTQLSEARMFSSLDATSGYHQIVVDPESRKYLSFTTPIGRYQYKRLPFGVSNAPELYQKVMSHIFKGLKGVIIYLDDILVFAKNQQEHDERLKEVLKRVRDSGIKLNKEKCQFAVSKIKFLGHELSEKGIMPQLSKITALTEYPVPQTVKEVRSFLGLAEYVGHRFINGYSEYTAHIWPAIKDDKFNWSADTQNYFDALKVQFAKIEPLKFYDPQKDVAIQIDASGIGLGAVLLQDDKPVMFASRKLLSAETRYTHIEKEFLGLVFALFRFKTFIFGKHVKVYTDNKPMMSFVNREIDKMPLRIQKWILALQPFDFTLVHLAGVKNKFADALSRAPIDSSRHTEETTEETVCLVLSDPPVTLKELMESTACDDELQCLKESLINGSTGRHDLIKSYVTNVSRMSLDADRELIFFDSRIIVPKALRHKILREAHAGHIGQNQMADIIRSNFYWPKLYADVEKYVRNCSTCVTFSCSNKRAPMRAVGDSVKEPWHTIAVDFVGGGDVLNGKLLFSVIDYASRYPFAVPVKTSSAREAINVLTEIFAIFGMPRVLISDNGPAFVSEEFTNFLSRCNVEHRRASTYYPQSNGVVERFHYTFKRRMQKLLHDHVRFDIALRQCLFDIRRAPNTSTGEAPFSLLFKRAMPTQWHFYSDKGPVCSKRDLQKTYVKRDERHHAKLLHFNIGDTVLLRNGKNSYFTKQCHIVSKVGHGAWRVKHNDGRIQVVNQRFIKLAPKHSNDDDSSEQHDTDVKKFYDLRRR